MRTVLDWSLLSGPVPIVLRLLALAAAGWLLARMVLPRSPRHAVVVTGACAIAAATITVTAAYLARTVWLLFPDRLETSVYAWVFLGVFTVAITAVHTVTDRRRYLPISVAAAITITAACGNQVNLEFEAFPTVADILTIERTPAVPFTDIGSPSGLLDDTHPIDTGWTPPPGMPTRGKHTSAPIPGTKSGFAGRDAEIYLPPAYFTDPRPRLPVLVLLAGQPGSPQDWMSAGKLTRTMDNFAAAHQGLAPVVVVADGTGTQFGNPLCLNSRRGNAATYLSVDVPAWITAHLSVDTEPRAWAVGGLSYGGTCALQLAINYPQVYPTFLDLSGQAEPSLGDRRTTVEEAFGGDTAAFTRVNPLDLLRTRRYPGSAGTIVVGTRDPEAKADASTVTTAARAAGMEIRYSELPGEHSWRVWTPGLARELPWLAQRLGLIS
ncbi:alpha/beta hydrolase [Nocardia fluminea]|uniref:S-formylglutathione hydrolase FrmB n=1 Tax=Nocardia fluminea TaxID=134984 RepID=A0A2N3V4X7_9NOCA|nr:alpha/beta hydrolase-fold protein [Nocardia fluminea]PKV76674.1 S-formylglutathione hydrolase FrmB [Nocardia fluminea]